MIPRGWRSSGSGYDPGGSTPVPRIFNSGPYFGSARPGWNPTSHREELHAEVDHWVERGVKGFQRPRGSEPDHLRWLIERAHWHGPPRSRGHLDSGYRNSVITPGDAVAHGDRPGGALPGRAGPLPSTQSAYASFPGVVPGTPEFDDITDLFIRYGVYYNQTLSAYGYFGSRDDGVFDFWTDESASSPPPSGRPSPTSPPPFLCQLRQHLPGEVPPGRRLRYEAGGVDEHGHGPCGAPVPTLPGFSGPTGSSTPWWCAGSRKPRRFGSPPWGAPGSCG